MLSILYTTIGSQSEAEALATKALEARLAVCVNIIPGGVSLYLWNNAIDRSPECYLFFKTTPDKIDDLETFIQEHHPYDVPAVLRGTVGASAPFSNYVTSSLSHTNASPASCLTHERGD